MSSDEEVGERFEVSQYDIDNEFNPNRGRRKRTKVTRLNRNVYACLQRCIFKHCKSFAKLECFLFCASPDDVCMLRSPRTRTAFLDDFC